ncbi:MAG: cupin domain-containing protein [Chloroflexota bacterium]
MAQTKDDLKQGVEDYDGIVTIRGGGELKREWNNIRYKQGMSGKNVGSKELSMNVATIPVGGVALAHIHVDFEVMLYILQGKVRHDYGDKCKESLENGAGDFIYIAPGLPHEVFNIGDEEVVAVVARSDAAEWANIVRYNRETGELIEDDETSA